MFLRSSITLCMSLCMKFLCICMCARVYRLYTQRTRFWNEPLKINFHIKIWILILLNRWWVTVCIGVVEAKISFLQKNSKWEVSIQVSVSRDNHFGFIWFKKQFGVLSCPGELKYFNSRMFFLPQGELFTEYKSRIMPSLTPFECH